MGLIESIDAWASGLSGFDKAVFIFICVIAIVLFSFVVGHAIVYFFKYGLPKLRENARRRRFIESELATTQSELARVRIERAREGIATLAGSSRELGISMEEAAEAMRLLNMNVQGNVAERMAEQMALGVDREIVEQRELTDETGYPISAMSESSYWSADSPISASLSLTSDEEPVALYGHRIPPDTIIRIQNGRDGQEYIFVCGHCRRVYEGLNRREFVASSRLNKEFTMRSVAESQRRHMIRIHRVPEIVKPEWESTEVEEAPPVRVIRIRRKRA